MKNKVSKIINEVKGFIKRETTASVVNCQFKPGVAVEFTDENTGDKYYEIINDTLLVTLNSEIFVSEELNKNFATFENYMYNTYNGITLVWET